MAATPKAKPAPSTSHAPPSRLEDRTSTVVGATLILLTGLGVVTVFWEPITALAGGGPTADSMAETRATAPDAGASTAPPPSTNAAGTALDASGSS